MAATTEEKMARYEQMFWRDFINTEKGTPGFCIPVLRRDYNADSTPGSFNVGDGTINLALLVALLSVTGNEPVGYADCLDTIERLGKKAYEYFNLKFEFMDIPDYSDRFFVRDDYDYKTQPVAWGSYKMLETLESEDPCHSPFTSQDQVWNLNPALSCIMENDPSLRSRAMKIGEGINSYIADNGYKLFNPYVSYIRHFFNYLPSMNEKKVAPWERQQDRTDHFKLTDKVKRGANNWYYSGGTSACLQTFMNGKKTYKNGLRTLLYKIEIAFLDRIYEPLYRLFTKNDFKHNSYYCYGACSGIWYSNYKKRFLKQFESNIKKGKLFEPNLVPFVISYSDLSDKAKKSLKLYFDNLPELVESGTVESPLESLVVWKWTKKQ